MHDKFQYQLSTRYNLLSSVLVLVPLHGANIEPFRKAPTQAHPLKSECARMRIESRVGYVRD